MTKYIKYASGLFLLIACFSVSQAYGQTQLEKARAENKRLADRVQELTKSRDSLADSVQKKRNDLESLQTTLKSNQCDIDEAGSDAQQNKLKELRSQVESLEKEVREMGEKNIALQAQKNELKTKITDAESNLNNLGEFQALKARQEAEQQYEQNKLVLKRRYSQISEAELNEISSTVDAFKEMDGWKEYKKRVTAAVANKRLYERADSLLRIPYTDEVRILHNQLYLDGSGLLKIKKDNSAKGVFKFSEDDLDGKGSQFHEMDEIDISLSRYKDGVSALKGIINRVNQDKEVAGYRNTNDSSKKRECLEAIMKAIESFVFTVDGKKYNKQEITERYFTRIPYLKDAYEKYLDQLKKSPLETTEIEREILSIKVNKEK